MENRLRTSTAKCSAKLMPAIVMKAIATDSTARESKKPRLESCVEKPPMATVEKAWQIASNTPMPATQ